MNIGHKEWRIVEHDEGLQQKLVSELQVSPIIAKILINRGITSPSAAKDFLLTSSLELADPMELPEMDKAVQRILKALELNQKILIYGDYDVDGITSTALLTSILEQLGGNVSYYLPDRMEEGYGLNKQALEWAKNEAKIDLLITVDCGIASWEEVDYGNKLGIDIIITDHHEPSSIVPKGIAVVNPKLDSESRLKNLAGVGVAFKLVQALYQAKGIKSDEDILASETLDLVVLGTIADVVPLLGENRLIVKYGLPILNSSIRPGIRALIEVAGLEGKKISAGQVAFTLAPRLNAVGRMGSAVPAVELLLTTSKQRAWELANILNRENEERQLVESQIYREVCELIEEEIDFTKDNVIILSSPLWHAGVIGIVASKITERFHRPTILLAIEGDKAKGSGRSIKGFDLFTALKNCSQFLLKYGGHHQAAGISLLAEDIPRFRAMLNEYAKALLTPEMLKPVLTVDSEIAFEDINSDLYEQLELLQPHGCANPEPVLCCSKVRITQWRQVGKKGNHLKAKVRRKYKELDAIGFNLASFLEKQTTELPVAVDLAFNMGLNEWNGHCSLQLVLKDLHYHCPFSSSKVKLKTNIGSMLDKLSINSRTGVLSILKAPLRRISTGVTDLLQRHSVSHGLQIASMENQNVDQNYSQLAGKVMVATRPHWDNRQHLLEECHREIFNPLEFLISEQAVSQVYDERRDDKIKCLEQLISSEKKLIVFLNYRQNAEHIAKHLEHKYPELTGKIKVFFNNNDFEEQMLEPGSVRILLTNQFLEFDNWPNFNAQVLFEPPFSTEELRIRLTGDSKTSLYLLWSSADLDTNRKMLEAMFPQSGFIIELSKFVGAIQPGCVVDPRVLARDLNMSFKYLEYIKLHSTLKVLCELGIIDYKNGTYFGKGPTPEPVLSQSAYFNEGKNELAALAAFNNSTFPWKVTTGVG